jgi:hypothetical protein
MHSIADPKTMAKALRADLAALGLTVNHAQALEIAAHQLGFRDWNTLSAAHNDDLLLQPRHWSLTNNTSALYYRFGIDPKRGGAAMLTSRGDRAEANAGEFASYMQSVLAGAYRGQRLRLRAKLASQDAEMGFIWMRVDDGHNNILRFDNMTKRPENGPLKGTHDWVKRSIVLDIPEPAHAIHYGFLLKGRGTLWAKDFQLDAVGPEVNTTERNGKFLSKPENLDFTLA